jgi:hypothetical protein
VRSWIVVGCVVAALAVSPALAKSSAGSDAMKSCAASWKQMSPADKAKTTYKAYSTSCLSGKGTTTSVAAPAAMIAAPAKPAAMAPAAHATAAPAAIGGAMSGAAAGSMAGVPAGATGKCKDGTYTMSKTHSGACSHHGGVANWL